MLRSLVDVGIAFVDLLAAQARDVTDDVSRVGSRLALLAGFAAVAAVLVLGGAGLMVWALFLALEARMTTPQAALLTGGALWVLVALAAWVVLASTRRKAVG